MRSMSLVHNKRNPEPVDSLRNAFYIRYNSVISWRSDQYGFDIFAAVKTVFHIFRRDSSVYPRFGIFPGINAGYLQSPEIGRMINSLMTISGYKDMPFFFYGCRYSGQYRRRTSVDTVKTFFCPVKRRRGLFCLSYDSLRMMKIIKSMYFCNIPFNGKIPCHRQGISFMPRHVEGVVIRFCVFFQLFIQSFHDYFSLLNAASSHTTVTSLWNCRIDAGTWGVTGPVRDFAMISALSAPEATRRIFFAFMIVPIPIV